MFYGKIHEQTILEISEGDYIGVTADSFLIDRQARELSKHTLRFYREFLRTFIEYCNANSLTVIQQIKSDFLRRYFLAFGEKHNPGGVHGAYRTLRAFFQWLMQEEVMAPDWKNPMLKIKAPKVVLDPLEPISFVPAFSTAPRFQISQAYNHPFSQVKRCPSRARDDSSHLHHTMFDASVTESNEIWRLLRWNFESRGVRDIHPFNTSRLGDQKRCPKLPPTSV
jgi:hypothetical protein